MSIEALLRGLGLEHYFPAFEEHAITEAVLPHLDMADLREIGVGPVGHRKLILKAIEGGQNNTAGKSIEEANTPLAQHRQLTILFADLVGSTQLSQRLDAEDLRDLIRAYQDASKAAIERYDGYVAQYLGDGIVVYFGYPQSHEDNVERAIRAGLRLIDAVSEIDAGFGRDRGVEVKVRIGIEAGPVIVGDIIGEGVSRERAVVGETPNLAARLQSEAAPGEVVIGPTARGLVGGNVQLRDLGPRQIKGYENTLRVWRVVGLGFAGGRFERHRDRQLSHFVGRKLELKRLRKCLEAVRAGGNELVEIVGDPGIGKSRLVHEFLSDRVGATRLLTCHCASHAGSTAFFPFIDMFQRLLRRDADSDRQVTRDDLAKILARSGLDPRREIPYVEHLMGIGDERDVDPDLIGVRTAAALTRYLRSQGRILPTILFVNDLHWIDERSEEVLRSLAVREDNLEILILCTYRPDYVADWPASASVVRIELTPLSAGDTADLFSHCFGDGVGEQSGEALRRTGGNPLFVEELAGHMRNPNAGAIPDTLAGLLLERVDAQSAGAQRILRTASVAGRHFSSALVAGAVDPEADQPAFQELLDSGLIVRDGDSQQARYRFKHALVQDAIYDGLLAEDRRVIHGLVGRRTEAAYPDRLYEMSESLSHHFEIAGDRLKAARYAYRAGGKAFDLFALRGADHWFRRAIDLFPDDADPDDERLRAQAISNHIQISCWDARFSDMIDLAEGELARIEALGDTREVSRVLSWLGEGHLNCSNYATANQLLSRALSIGERLKDLDSIGYALGELGWLKTITILGDGLSELEDHADRLANIADNLGDNYLHTLAHYIRWAALIHIGNVDAARSVADSLVDVGRSGGYPPALNWGHCMQSYCAAEAGELTAASEFAHAARSAAQCAFDNLMADLCLGIVQARRGDIEACKALLGRSQRLGDQVGSLFFAYASEADYGRALAEAGEMVHAVEWLSASQAAFEAASHPRAAALCALALGEILTASAEPRAAECLADARRLASATGMQGVLAAVA